MAKHRVIQALSAMATGVGTATAPFDLNRFVVGELNNAGHILAALRAFGVECQEEIELSEKLLKAAKTYPDDIPF